MKSKSIGLSPKSFYYGYDSKKDLKHLVRLVLILVFIALLTGMIGIWVVYRSAHERHLDMLRAFANTQGDVLDAYMLLDEVKSGRVHGDTPHEHNLDNVKELLLKQESFLETGQLLLAYEDTSTGKYILIGTGHMPSGQHSVLVVENTRELTPSMRLALEGKEGVLEGQDLHGAPVVTAYLPISKHNAGLVVMLNQSEFYAPYHRARLITLGIGVVFVVFGTWVIWSAEQKNLRQVREREQLIRLSFENSAIGKALVAPDGSWLRANKSLVNILGYTEDELLRMDFQSITYPEDLEADLDHVQAMLKGEINVYHMDKRYFHKSGDIIWSHLSVSLVRDEQGEPKFFISQIQDITERKRVEFENQRLHERLMDQLSLRRQQLDTASGALEGFAYSVSHDLRAPLRAMSGFSQALQEEYGDKLDDTASDYIRRIHRASTNMAELIDSILRLSRTSFGELNVVSLDITAMSKRVVENCRVVEPDYPVEVRVAPGLKGQGDLRLIGSVLDNLIGNAWKYTHGVENPLIEVGQEHVTLSEQSDDSVLAFYVRDNGVGFDMAYSNKLFRPFQRIHSDREFEGSGVGLASAQTIINRHGGQIWAQGQTGKGATFYFTLNHTQFDSEKNSTS